MMSKAHILVVEDEVNIRSALMTMLEKLGHTVRGAGNAEDALALLEDFPADLVITDLRMPGLGGMELLRRMKERWP